MTRIVGFGHRSGHGKDSCVKFLETELRIRCPRLRVKKLSFAHKLKDICHQLYGWAGVQPMIHYENHYNDRKIILPALGMTVVDVWVKVGEALRGVYERTWLDWVVKTDHKADVILVGDVRHPNEANCIVANVERDWRLYKVYNHRIPNRELVSQYSIDHYLDGYDHWHGVIENAGELSDLHPKMSALADELIEAWKLRG